LTSECRRWEQHGKVEQVWRPAREERKGAREAIMNGLGWDRKKTPDGGYKGRNQSKGGEDPRERGGNRKNNH